MDKSFREKILKRDKYFCKFCGRNWKSRLVVHLIFEEHMPNGGLVASNAITLCEAHLAMAEVYHDNAGERWEDKFHPHDLYQLIGSSLDKAVQDAQQAR